MAKNRYSISEAAKLANTTSGTLRHYDHIGLVSPHETDKWTGYRYYSEQEIIRLNTIQALQLMDMPLKEIGQILKYDDLEKIIACFYRVEKNADEKIRKLQEAKLKIKRARNDYEKKWNAVSCRKDLFTQQLPERRILLHETLESPTIDNLTNYHKHFFDQLTPSQKPEFQFEDLAGIYTADGSSRLFAQCLCCPDEEALITLPKGTYLCADCSETEREEVLHRLMEMAKKEYGISPLSYIQLIVVSGILQWNYQLQIFVTPN